MTCDPKITITKAHDVLKSYHIISTRADEGIKVITMKDTNYFLGLFNFEPSKSKSKSITLYGGRGEQSSFLSLFLRTMVGVVVVGGAPHCDVVTKLHFTTHPLTN